MYSLHSPPSKGDFPTLWTAVRWRTNYLLLCLYVCVIGSIFGLSLLLTSLYTFFGDGPQVFLLLINLGSATGIAAAAQTRQHLSRNSEWFRLAEKELMTIDTNEEP